MFQRVRLGAQEQAGSRQRRAVPIERRGEEPQRVRPVLPERRDVLLTIDGDRGKRSQPDERAFLVRRSVGEDAGRQHALRVNA